MSAGRRWLVGTADQTKHLAEALNGTALATDTLLDAIETDASTAAVAFVPEIPDAAPFDTEPDARTVHIPILWLTSEMQSALARFGSEGGSVVILLPQSAAMGEAGKSAASAVTGAAVSMARTWAIELAKRRVRVNTILYSESLFDSGNHTIADAVATQVDTFWNPRAASITGQEVFVTNGLDTGRLHP